MATVADYADGAPWPHVHVVNHARSYIAALGEIDAMDWLEPAPGGPWPALPAFDLPGTAPASLPTTPAEIRDALGGDLYDDLVQTWAEEAGLPPAAGADAAIAGLPKLLFPAAPATRDDSAPLSAGTSDDGGGGDGGDDAAWLHRLDALHRAGTPDPRPPSRATRVYALARPLRADDLASTGPFPTIDDVAPRAAVDPAPEPAPAARATAEAPPSLPMRIDAAWLVDPYYAAIPAKVMALRAMYIQQRRALERDEQADADLRDQVCGLSAGDPHANELFRQAVAAASALQYAERTVALQESLLDALEKMVLGGVPVPAAPTAGAGAGAGDHSSGEEDASSHSSGGSGASRASASAGRKRFHPQVVAMLESYFRQNPYPDDDARRYIASTLNLTLKQVINWFTNKRMRLSYKVKG